MIKPNKKLVFFLKFIIIFFELLLLRYFINIINKSSSYSSNFNIIKKTLQNIIYKKFKKNITYINFLFINSHSRFGNFFIALNNVIIFCEIFRCKKIIIVKNNDYIKGNIFYQKYNLTLEPNYSHNFIDNNSMFINIKFFYYKCNFTVLGKVNRFYLFRKEIINNLPKVKINLDDIYIYIRGGDIFRRINKSVLHFYIQPPLCFYKKVLNQFSFREVSIISQDISNPVVLVLLKDYPYIKYNKNNIKLDISYLSNSFNIVSATSSFILSIIKLNQNLKFLWEYDFYKLSERYLHLHYSVYTFSFNYTIYKMNLSKNYINSIYPFKNSEKQRSQMIEAKCDNNFYIIPPRIS
jgi:hypothetical protein